MTHKIRKHTRKIGRKRVRVRAHTRKTNKRGRFNLLKKPEDYNELIRDINKFFEKHSSQEVYTIPRKKGFKNRGRVFKAIDLKSLREEAKRTRNKPIGEITMFRGETEPIVESEGIASRDVLKFTNIDKVFDLLKQSRIRTNTTPSEVKELIRQGRTEEAFRKLPREAKITLNLARGGVMLPEPERETKIRIPTPVEILEERAEERGRNKLLSKGDDAFFKFKETGDEKFKIQAQAFYAQANTLQ